MNLRSLQQADQCLSKCGKPLAPPGVSVVYLYRGIAVQTTVATSSQTTITKEIQGECVFELRAISGLTTSTEALYVQVQLPDGRFLMSNLMDVTQVAGYGSTRYLLTKPLACPPGSKITVTFDTNLPSAGSSQPIMLLFEGADRIYLKGGKPYLCPDEFASSLPRYIGNANQNIMAPSWMQGFTPDPPQGYEDEAFTYASGVFGQPVGLVTVALAGPLTATVQINIEQNYTFEMRRLLCEVEADNTVTAGSFLGRVRDGSGYALTDDYLDIARYLGSAPMTKGWVVKPGDSIYIDLQLVDSAGSGNMYFQAFAEGLRRRAA